MNQQEQDQLVIDHMPLVRKIALTVYEGLPHHVEADDLIANGTLGLVDAARRYDETRKVPFHFFARHRIKGAIIDGLRNLDWISRDSRRGLTLLELTSRELEGKLNREPTRQEIADHMKMPLEKVDWLMSLRQQLSIDTPLNVDDGVFADGPWLRDDHDEQPDRQAERSFAADFLHARVENTLPPRYQQVIELYYGERSLTMKEIGGILGINESRVSQIHATSLEKLREACHDYGVHSTQDLIHA